MVRSAARFAMATRTRAHVGKPGADIGRIDLAHESDPAFLFQVALHQSEGGAVPLQRLVAMVAPRVILQVVVDRMGDSRVGASVCQQSPLLVLPLDFLAFLWLLLRLLRSHFGLCIELCSLRVGAVPCHMFAASECSGPRLGCLGVIRSSLVIGTGLLRASGGPGNNRTARGERGRMSRLRDRQDVACTGAGCHLHVEGRMSRRARQDVTPK